MWVYIALYAGKVNDVCIHSSEEELKYAHRGSTLPNIVVTPQGEVSFYASHGDLLRGPVSF